MKRKAFIKMLKKNGWWLVREGGDHSVYTNGSASESVPRHTELDDDLIRAIIKRRELK